MKRKRPYYYPKLWEYRFRPERALKIQVTEDEIIYHVFQRSFFDSNGDGHGDFRGLEQKLDYIQELGATSILILPIYQSSYYHNYFASDFRAIDPKYGSFKDYLSLIRNIHQRGMKLYLDMEIQYVTEDHIWFKDSFMNPDSPYSEHILYNGANNTEPETIIFNLSEIHSYDGTVKKVACLDLFNENTRKELTREFLFWADPFGDGTLRDGIDGFRLDHMMDDLDNKGRLVEVYAKFWKPLIDEVKSLNPDITFIGEQADWESNGRKAFEEAGVDAMFAFPLKFAISSFHRGEIWNKVMRGSEETPSNKQQIILLENHDTSRFASVVEEHAGRLRVGAALNFFLKGTPCIYYGQELGMKGQGGFASYGLTDGNDIPRREAFPWFAKVDKIGMAIWYRDSGPWWDDTNLKDNSGISVEEQERNPHSLLNFYKKLIKFRKANRALGSGSLELFDPGNDDVLAFNRKADEQSLSILVNLSSEKQRVNFDFGKNNKLMYSFPESAIIQNGLPAYGIQVWENVEDLD